MTQAQKVAISMPGKLLSEIDACAKKLGQSRSRYIALAVAEKIALEKKSSISACYDRVFSDEDIQKEQSDTAGAFDSAGCPGGQEW